jgi:hypothetical protein
MPAVATRIPGSLAPAEPKDLLRESFANAELLGQERTLQVRVFRAEQAPTLLSEVGRLREVTFRSNGEGTGFALALDPLDDVYVHLVVWDQETSEVVAGLRLGILANLLQADGTGSSTGESFAFAPSLTQRLREGIELGRAFVVPSYPRQREPMALLWKGLGVLLDRVRPCRLLLGRVPIPPTYSPAARKEIASFLLSGPHRSPWADEVKARVPFEISPRPAPDLAELERRVFALEGRRPPLLVIEYCRLGMRGLAAAKDLGVRGRVHVLCVTDLRETPVETLREFLGADAANRFLSRQAATG